MLKSARRSVWLCLGLGYLVFCSAALAYYRIFTGFAEWDDEGTLMMTVRQFLSGSTLYEIVRSGYGPVYYFYNWVVRSLTFTGVSHDVTRVTSAVIWTVCALACAWIVWNFGRSLTAALVTHLLVFRTLAFFCNEPGHPQELCMMLLIGLAASGLAAESNRTRPIATVLAGVLPAALLLVKINIGIFAVLAVSLAILCHAPRGPLVAAARYLAGAASVALPFVLMRAHLNQPSEIAYCAAVTAGIAALLAVATKRDPLFSFRDCMLAAAAFVFTCAIVLGILLTQGVAPSTILRSLVLDHIQLSVMHAHWYLPVGLKPWWILWAIAGPPAALVWYRTRKAAPHVLPQYVPAALGAVGLLLAFFVQSNQLLGFITPFCWIVTCSFDRDNPRQSYGRFLLVGITVLQTLYAYPLAGSQAPFTRVLLIVVAGVGLADGLRGFSPRLRERPMVRAIPVAVTALLLLTYPIQISRARAFCSSDTPLNLPGATRIRLDSRKAETLQWLVTELKQNCDTFVGYPGIPSLYFWSGKPMPGPAKKPPGPLNADAWTLILTPSQQQPIVDEFARHPDGCVIYYPTGVEFWNRGGFDDRSLPLVSYIAKNLKTVRSRGGHQFQVRTERRLDVSLRP